jgi:hypothetical protein
MTHKDQILEVISQFTDITRDEIKTLMGNSNISFGPRLIDLVNSGEVTRRKELRSGRLIWVYSPTGKIPMKRGHKVSTPTKLEPKYEPKGINSPLYEELLELREWKHRALIAYPELDVDPLVYKAREIFARHTEDKKLKDDIYSGKLDKRPPMLALVEVLENGT